MLYALSYRRGCVVNRADWRRSMLQIDGVYPLVHAMIVRCGSRQARRTANRTGISPPVQKEARHPSNCGATNQGQLGVPTATTAIARTWSTRKIKF
jgi:hypothetical protein